MEVRPPLRHDELDHTCYDQERKRAEARREPQDQQDRQYDLRYAVEVREHSGKRKLVRVSEDVQLELFAEEILRAGGKLLLVANRQLPYESELAEYFRNTRVLMEDRRFKVLLAGGE